jgi:hypothetical protein
MVGVGFCLSRPGFLLGCLDGSWYTFMRNESRFSFVILSYIKPYRTSKYTSDALHCMNKSVTHDWPEDMYDVPRPCLYLFSTKPTGN